MAAEESSSPERLEPAPKEQAATTPDVKADPSSAPAAEASSAEAQKGETKETLLEAVTKAVKPADDEDEERSAEKSSGSESAKPGTEAQAGEKEQGDLSRDPSAEELEGYPERTRRRVRQLIEARDSFKAEAEVTRTLREFLVTNDIAREDFQLTLDLAAAMRRGDFKSFLEGVGPYVQLATQALGITLPPDLQQEVQAGRVNYDAAAQISRERYARALADQRAQRATQVLTSQHTAQQQTQFSQAIERTVAAWENGIRQSDPDYARKEETTRNFLWAVIRETGPPQSPEHAVAIAQEAYNRANNTFRAYAPQPRATRAVPSSINRSAAPNARPAPTSMMEAALLGLERARR